MSQENIKIIKEKVSESELRSFLGKPFDDMVKFVVDVEKEIMAIGGEMHVDAEQVLLKDGSEQKNLWGGNIYPDKEQDKKIEYESLINIRPSQNNRSIEIKGNELKTKIKIIVERWIDLSSGC